MTRTDLHIASRHAVIGRARLAGTLSAPLAPRGIVIFAHGSGSSRFSPRNIQVAAKFHARGLATLLFDLLTQAESISRTNVFDVELLGTRLAEAIRWAGRHRETAKLPIGLFGASTGAAAALIAAAAMAAEVAAVVSRGGRPDLAGDRLPRVRAPTLLIVGGADHDVVELNQQALAQLTCVKRLEIVAGATHLFEEPGALDQVVDLAGRWFEQHLGSAPQ